MTGYIVLRLVFVCLFNSGVQTLADKSVATWVGKNISLDCENNCNFSPDLKKKSKIAFLPFPPAGKLES